MEAVIQLGAQIANVDIDDVGLARVVEAPYLLQNLIAGQHCTLVAQEILQEVILALCKRDRLPIHLHLIAREEHDEIFHRQAVGCIVRRDIAAAERVADACDQLRHGKRLRDVVVRTDVESLDPVLHRIARRQHDDGHV